MENGPGSYYDIGSKADDDTIFIVCLKFNIMLLALQLLIDCIFRDSQEGLP